MPILCACFRITEEALRGIIADNACASVEDVSVLTGACRGCQTCRPDIEAMLRSVNGPTGTPPVPPPASGPSPGSLLRDRPPD